MRLISQNGMVDVLYENVCISINYRNKNQITAWNFGCKDYEIVTMATYSNTDKALKVMEMLRNAYCGLPIIMKNVDISDEVIELLKDLKKNGIIFQKVEENPSVECVDNTYFKFPADEEVEVQE